MEGVARRGRQAEQALAEIFEASTKITNKNQLALAEIFVGSAGWSFRQEEEDTPEQCHHYFCHHHHSAASRLSRSSPPPLAPHVVHLLCTKVAS